MYCTFNTLPSFQSTFNIISLISPSKPSGGKKNRHYYPHFTDKDNENQKLMLSYYSAGYDTRECAIYQYLQLVRNRFSHSFSEE